MYRNVILQFLNSEDVGCNISKLIASMGWFVTRRRPLAVQQVTDAAWSQYATYDEWLRRTRKAESQYWGSVSKRLSEYSVTGCLHTQCLASSAVYRRRHSDGVDDRTTRYCDISQYLTLPLDTHIT